jgi:hypothetical protein
LTTWTVRLLAVEAAAEEVVVDAAVGELGHWF